MFAQKDDFAGFYKGEAQSSVYPTKEEKILFVQVVRCPKETYKLTLISRPFVRSDEHFSVSNLKAVDGRLSFENVKYDAFTLSGFVDKNGTVELKGNSVSWRGKTYPFSFKGTRYEYKSPTLGLKPPANAVVLFDGTSTDKFYADNKEKSPCHWNIVECEDGVKAMLVNSGADGKKHFSMFTKDVFNGKLRIHIEFRIPEVYDRYVQDKGNSGFFIGPYEVQILDSFGLDSKWNDCGAIYRQTPPKVNACLEECTWQTYDIEFTPARYDGSLLVSVPRITVRQNGILIHNDTPIYRATTLMEAEAKNYVHPTKDFRIMLQDHSSPVRFRNFWIVEK